MKPPAIFLMGPTASGKTAATEALISRFPVEIISVDSALVYRGMDIGTAKPDASFLTRVPHHLIDVCDPVEPYSAGRFRDDATSLMADITARGKIPLLVGGTMLYFRSLEKFDDLPDADPSYRQELQQVLDALGPTELHRRLAAVDPDSAERLHPNDSQRLVRALELNHVTGKPVANLQQQGGQNLPYQLLKLGLFPEDRAKLHQRIEKRLTQMFDQGFVAEVSEMYSDEKLSPNLPALRAVGYRQVWEYLDGKSSLPEAQERSLFATRQLAKRQLTWLRKEPDLRKIDPLSAQLESVLATAIENFLPKP
ncbi:MAG: tRNA dimethylallyltransferase [Gammaproteobacteria bacterium]|jgi:tRNA dimethylallyltransferase